MKKFSEILFSFAALLIIFLCIGREIAGEENAPASFDACPEETLEDTVYRGAGDGNVKILMSEHDEVASLSREEYITWALFAEMPAGYPEEALKAGALCVSAYAARRRAEEASAPSEDLMGADISDDFTLYPRFLTEAEAKEMYKDSYDEAYERISAAAKYAAGKVILYENEPIIAACHGVCAGVTESALVMWGEDIPYLVSVDSSFDLSSPDFISEYGFTEAEVKARLGAFYETDIYDDIPLTEIKEKEKSPAGTVLSVDIGEYAVSGSDFAEIFSLPSYNYSFSFPKENLLTVSCRGRGSGVGLSRYGAKELALAGYSCEDIIKHYFTGAEVCDICFENSAV